MKTDVNKIIENWNIDCNLNEIIDAINNEDINPVVLLVFKEEYRIEHVETNNDIIEANNIIANYSDDITFYTMNNDINFILALGENNPLNKLSVSPNSLLIFNKSSVTVFNDIKSFMILLDKGKKVFRVSLT